MDAGNTTTNKSEMSIEGAPKILKLIPLILFFFRLLSYAPWQTDPNPGGDSIHKVWRWARALLFLQPDSVCCGLLIPSSFVSLVSSRLRDRRHYGKGRAPESIIRLSVVVFFVSARACVPFLPH